MVDRRENEASSNQMKADGREIDGTSGPFRAGFQKNLANQTSSLKTSLSRSALLCLLDFWGWSKPAPAINRLSSNELPVSPRSYELPGCYKLVAKTIVLVMFFNPNEIKQ